MVAYILEVGPAATPVDVTDDVSPETLVLTHSAYGDISKLGFTIDDEDGSLTPDNEQLVRLTQDGAKHFEGILRSLGKTDSGLTTQKVYDCICQDYNSRLDDDVVDAGLRSVVESDKDRITWLVSTFGTHGIAAGSSVVQLHSSLPEQDFTGLSLHQCLTLIASVTGGSFYVDFDKNLHYFDSEVISAPFGLSDDPNFSTTFPYESFKLPSDSAEMVNAVYVIGTDIAGWRYKGGSAPAAGTKRARVIRDPSIIDAVTLAAVGDAFLASNSDPRQPGSLTTYRPGLRAGMTVQITHAGHGLIAEPFRIASIEARPNTKDRIAHVVNFGSRPLGLDEIIGGTVGSIAALGKALGEVEASITDLSIGGGNLVPNSSFEDGTAWTVGAQWVIGFDPTPSAAYAAVKVGRLALAAATAGALRTPYIVVDRTDSYWVSAYRFLRSRSAGQLRMIVEEYDVASALLRTTVVGSAAAAETEWGRWSVHFDNTADAFGRIAWLAGTVKIRVGFDSAGASGTLTADVDAVQVERNDFLTAYAPSPTELLSAPITTTQIADDAVTTPKLIANAVTAGKIAAAAVSTAALQALAVTADKIDALAVRIGHFADPSSVVLCPNPGFEDLTGVTVGAVSQPIPGWQSLSYARIVASPVDTGLSALELAGNGTALAIRSVQVATLPNRRVRLRARIRGNAGNNAASAGRIALEAYGPTGTLLSTLGSTTVVVGAGTAYVEIAAPDIVLPAGTDTVRTLLESTAATPSGSEVHFDSIECYYLDLDVSHAAGQVRIDSLGAHFFNSLIEIFDTGGHTIFTGGGFSGSLDDFMASAFYNNTFGSGTLGALPAGLTASLPYWTVAAAGGGTATLEADSGTGSGNRVKFVVPNGGEVSVAQRAAVVNQFPRDSAVPFTATAYYNVTASAGSLGCDIRITATGYTKAGGALGTELAGFNVLPGVTGIGELSVTLPLDPTAAYVEIEVDLIDRFGNNSATAYLYGIGRTIADRSVPIEAELASNYTLTTTLVGSSLVLIALPPGRWLVIAGIDFSISATGVGQCVGELLMGASVTLVSGARQIVLGDVGNGTRALGSQRWVVDVAAGNSAQRAVELGFRKTVNAGTAAANATHTAITALPVVEGVGA